MLEIGILWADDVKHDLPGSVTRAAQRYQERTGNKANVAYVNPECFQECTIDGVTVRAEWSVMRGCVFVGEEAE